MSPGSNVVLKTGLDYYTATLVYFNQQTCAPFSGQNTSFVFWVPEGNLAGFFGVRF